MRKLVGMVLAAALGCGGGESSFQLQVASDNVSKGPDGASRLEMEAGNSLAVQMLVVGSVPGPVTFTADGLPAFAVQHGSLLTLSPGRAEAGMYSFTVTATSRGVSSTVPIDLAVSHLNSAPRWGSIFFTASFSDDEGQRGWKACPGAATCTAYGEPHIWVGVATDDDGDALHADVEVVPHGQAFSGTPTFSSPLADGNVTITFEGLTAGTTYDFAVRVVDAFGAIATPSFFPDGWVTPSKYPRNPDFGPAPEWAFEQGPCNGTQCACLATGSLGCAVDADCCSGSCAAAVGMCR
jgi:hypothetical protein